MERTPTAHSGATLTSRINIAAHTTAINNAKDLDALADAINAFVSAVRASDEDLDVQQHILEKSVAWDALPTFDGVMHIDDIGLYSWDATRLMYMSGWRPDIQAR